MTTTTEPDDSGEHSIATRAERQRAAHAVGDPPRRTMAVGRVWIVGLVCLAVGALLNAPGIRKTALSQDVGWKRDVATFLADPLYEASHALLLDRPRDGIQEAIGRPGQDDVELALPSPTIGTTPTTPPTAVPGQTTLPTTTTTVKLKDRKKFSPSKMLRLWVGGDSLAITPGESLINQSIATGLIGITSAVDGHVATGLARPEVFNWAGYMNEVINANDPDVVVLTIGSNDDQPLTGDNGVGEFGTEEWKAEYRRRVGGLMDFITSQSTRERELIWVGIPPVRNVGRYNDRYFLINDLTRQEALKRPGKVVWLDMGHSIGVGNDEYTDYLTNPDGSLVQVRAGDGIHFTRAGGDRIAAQILAGVNGLYDLTSWQNDVTTTSAPTTTTTTKKKEG